MIHFGNFFIDPDFFGGVENRKPYAGIEGEVSGALHPVFYIIPLLLIGIIVALFGIVKWVWNRYKKDGVI